MVIWHGLHLWLARYALQSASVHPDFFKVPDIECQTKNTHYSLKKAGRQTTPHYNDTLRRLLTPPMAIVSINMVYVANSSSFPLRGTGARQSDIQKVNRIEHTKGLTTVAELETPALFICEQPSMQSLQLWPNTLRSSMGSPDIASSKPFSFASSISSLFL